VLQTSTLDCGPASLSALLRGIGAPGSYEELRDVCATDVDGTSIDALESVAAELGVDAEQLVVPAEHVLALPDEYLPGIAVIELPDGFPHFVVAWRRSRRHVVVMDPAVGMRRIPHERFMAMLYCHSLEVAARDWREWAASDPFQRAIAARLARAGIAREPQQELLAAANADPGCAGLALLDGALRRTRSGGRFTAPEAACRWDVTCTPPLYSCSPTSDPESVVLTGAVIVRASHWDPNAGEQALIRRLSRTDPAPEAVARGLLQHPRLWIARLLAAAFALALVITAFRLALQPLLSRAPRAQLDSWRLALIAGSGLVGLLSTYAAATCGVDLDAAARRTWWSRVRHLPDSFTRTRPLSDLAERGHLLHRARDLPLYAFRALTGIVTTLAGTAAITVLEPAALPWALLLGSVVVGLPLATFRRAAELDFQVRTVSGSLARFTTDALLGAESLAALGGGDALRYEQEKLLNAWRQANGRLILHTTLVRGTGALFAAPLALACVATAHGSAASVALIAGLAVIAVDSTAVIADAVRGLAEARTSIARATGPLAAAANVEPIPVAPASRELRLSGLTVEAGERRLLDGVDATIPAGASVALVGISGSGKSTLLAAILGWYELNNGAILWGGEVADGADLAASTAWCSAETRLWNSGLAHNLSYGADTPDTLQSQLRQAELATLAAKLDRRPDPALGDAGTAISCGEGQRVRFGRSLGRAQPPLVVMDEPFSGLEGDRRRRLLREALDKWAGSTILCSTHDLDDARRFDYVAVMEAGRLVEFGRPTTLTEQADSAFARLLDAHATDATRGWKRITIGSPR
jgi:ABC-type transport system involved in cytochrome bd biosynthesis fused ATPase/permease subunit/predicted double-glycine peptidase